VVYIRSAQKLRSARDFLNTKPPFPRKFPARALFSLLAVGFGLHVPRITGQTPPPGGGPPASIRFNGFVRVIDASTFDVFLNGRRTGIGLVGVKAPQANTECGQLAVQTVNTLLRGATIDFDEDSSVKVDSRKRKMYHLRVNGDSLARKLVQNGLGDTTDEGDEQGDLSGDESQARGANAGCSGNPSKLIPLSPKVASVSTNDTVLRSAATPVVNPNVVLPSGFSSETVASGLTFPTNFAFLPDGRVLLVEKTGVVKMLKNGSVLPTPFIDLTSRVNSYWDHGLLGIAVDPNFATNGFVYVLYTYENDAVHFDAPKTSRLTRVTASGDTAPLGSEVVLLGTSTGAGCGIFPVGTDCISSDDASHSIGSVRAAPDGTLWVTAGDGASFTVIDDNALRAQNLDLLNGKLLHITNTGAGLSTNPFWNGTASANRSKV